MDNVGITIPRLVWPQRMRLMSLEFADSGEGPDGDVRCWRFTCCGAAFPFERSTSVRNIHKALVASGLAAVVVGAVAVGGSAQADPPTGVIPGHTDIVGVGAQ